MTDVPPPPEKTDLPSIEELHSYCSTLHTRTFNIRVELERKLTPVALELALAIQHQMIGLYQCVQLLTLLKGAPNTEYPPEQLRGILILLQNADEFISELETRFQIKSPIIQGEN